MDHQEKLGTRLADLADSTHTYSRGIRALFEGKPMLRYLRDRRRIEGIPVENLEYTFPNLSIDVNGNIRIKASGHVIIESGRGPAPSPSDVYGVWFNPDLDAAGNPIRVVDQPVRPAWIGYKDRASTQALKKKMHRHTCKCGGC